LAKAAAVLGRTEDAAYYQAISDRTKAAMQKAYFDEDGAINICTQTAHVLALVFGLAKEEHRQP
jgi:alpha-L-rhamnosidase